MHFEIITFALIQDGQVPWQQKTTILVQRKLLEDENEVFRLSETNDIIILSDLFF